MTMMMTPAEERARDWRQRPSAKRAGEDLPESWWVSEHEELDKPVGSWGWMMWMASQAATIRSRLRASASMLDPQELNERVLPIGAPLHCDLMTYEQRIDSLDDWSRRFLTALEAGFDPATAYVAMAESRTTSWRRQRERKRA